MGVSNWFLMKVSESEKLVAKWKVILKFGNSVSELFRHTSNPVD